MALKDETNDYLRKIFGNTREARAAADDLGKSVDKAAKGRFIAPLDSGITENDIGKLFYLDSNDLLAKISNNIAVQPATPALPATQDMLRLDLVSSSAPMVPTASLKRSWATTLSLPWISLRMTT